MEFIFALLGIIMTPLGLLVGKLAKSKLDNSKHDSLLQATQILVKVAELQFPGQGEGEKKHNHVATRLMEKFPWAKKVKIDEFIKAVVSEIKK
jgi:hypothetical protein